MKIKSKKDEIDDLKGTKVKLITDCQNTSSHAFKMLMQEEAEAEKAVQEKLGHPGLARHSVSRLVPLSQKEQAV